MIAPTLRAHAWLPQSNLAPPVSATAYESLLSCPLQLLYSRDLSFPRRPGPFARIGSAFHRALEQSPTFLGATDPPTAIAQLLELFRKELERERAAAETNPREVGLPWPELRVHHAEQALALLVHRIWSARSKEGVDRTAAKTEIELTTADGFLTGVLDRVDVTADGAVIVDYKSAEVMDEAHFERFRRQLLLYAFLWFEREGNWPIHGVINLLLAGKEVGVELDPQASRELVAEIRKAFAAVVDAPAIRLARPGDACNRCDYRPWCRPFWQQVAQFDGTDRRGVEGEIVAVPADPASPVFSLKHQGHTSQLVLDQRRSYFREQLRVGTRVRVIDPMLDGIPPAGRYRLGERSELWIVE